MNVRTSDSIFVLSSAAVLIVALICGGHACNHYLAPVTISACEEACASTGVLRIAPDECACRPEPGYGGRYGPLSEPEDDAWPPLESP